VLPVLILFFLDLNKYVNVYPYYPNKMNLNMKIFAKSKANNYYVATLNAEMKCTLIQILEICFYFAGLPNNELKILNYHVERDFFLMHQQVYSPQDRTKLQDMTNTWKENFVATYGEENSMEYPYLHTEDWWSFLIEYLSPPAFMDCIKGEKSLQLLKELAKKTTNQKHITNDEMKHYNERENALAVRECFSSETSTFKRFDGTTVGDPETRNFSIDSSIVNSVFL
jgi:hypothetical protein